MTGGATQLGCTGAQDQYLHHRARHGFFDPYFMSYENYSIESMPVHCQNFGTWNKDVTFRLPNNSECINGAYIEITLPEITAPDTTTQSGDPDTYTRYGVAWIHCIGFYIFERMEFKINSSTIDTHRPEYLDMWNRLTCPAGKRKGYNDLIGEFNVHTRLANHLLLKQEQYDDYAPQMMASSKPQFTLSVPLQFWWCGDATQALPIGVLLFCELSVTCKFQPAVNCVKLFSESGLTAADTAYDPDNWDDVLNQISASAATIGDFVDVILYVDYVFLTKIARNRFAKRGLFYVINQVRNYTDATVTNRTHTERLLFNMPISEIIFGVRETTATTDKNYHIWDRYYDNADAKTGTGKYNIPDTPITSAILKILTDERFTSRGYQYWSRIQAINHHTACPETRGIWCFNFAFNNEKPHANGSCNFSTSDTNQLILTFNSGTGRNGAAGTECGIGGTGDGGVTGTLYVFGRNLNYIFVNEGFATVLFSS